jgi:thiol-disulfide isomerase/thioredoxin
MTAIGQTLEWTYLYVHAGETRPLAIGPGQGVHRFHVPPGEYELYAYGRETYIARPRLVVEAGDPVQIQVDVPMGRLPRLIGQPAPELTSIKGWKNGGPASLADFRGQVVVLDFWGFWCGPCVHEMPELMALHDKYRDRGLVVMGVHDDSVASIAEMDEKLAEIRRDLWKGRDLPFLVALDGGGETLIEGSTLKTRGATTAAYGVRAFPTTILIDRAGKVVGRFRPRANEDIARLEKLLGE